MLKIPEHLRVGTFDEKVVQEERAEPLVLCLDIDWAQSTSSLYHYL